MVAGAAATDAVMRAHRLPGLRVGLHVTLVEGQPALPPSQIPDLVDASGLFRTDMMRVAFEIFFRPTVRRQLRAEIEAQFAAYRTTGLALDHVNAHKHFHLHPTIADAIISIGRSYGMRGFRVPTEPASVLAKVEAPAKRRLDGPVITPPALWLRRRARRAGLSCPDAVFGLAWSGAMTTSRLAGLINHLPEGRSEIYLHPATKDGFAGEAPGYRYAEEFAALVAPLAKAAARNADIALGGYADF
jgi:hopanoid biosynthesis associated protein HpnK